jgi:hypothetical protein
VEAVEIAFVFLMKMISSRYWPQFLLAVATLTLPAFQPATLARAIAAESPARVDRPALVFDSKRRKIVLFGGGFGEKMQGETWEHDGNAWINRHLPGPSKRNSHCMVFDGRRNRIVLFGGYGATGLLGDTWEYDGQNWRQAVTTGPSPRGAFGMAFDSKRGKTVLFGGSQDAGQPSFKDTWEWDGSKWTPVTTTAHPLGNYFHRMAFDEKRGQVISFGGRWGSSETWAFDGRDWQRLSVAGPPGRDHHAMTYDNRRGRIVIFGGARNLPGGGNAKGEPMLRDLWEWDGAKWLQANSDGPANYGGLPGFTYDSARQRLVLFGSSSDPALKVEVPGHWYWDGKRWFPAP